MQTSSNSDSKPEVSSSSNYISSEHYRQMLVRDGDRRFQEWHSKFLDYQKKFLNRS
jgi:hypothetical protein